MIGVLIGRDAAEYRDRLAAMTRALGEETDASWLAERELRWITGTPDQARATVRALAAAGVERIMLQDFLPWDLDMIDVMGEALLGQV
jgi:alkanesulfonate monooxygenase SsuD/methylene tetrahydromethanopterin reductase-like flavin-dependent oxidoreductase (luciferase family)